MGSWPATRHVFDDRAIWAIRAALAAERPLLVRGEPGCGKSQLARAAAFVTGRAFISYVVQARSESQDLLWSFDAVSRLGEAQALVAARGEVDIAARLDPGRFLSPGPLWWVFDWQSADTQYQRCIVRQTKPEVPSDWAPENGCVLLIDEIDKAEPDFPNDLLEALGNGRFSVHYLDRAIGLNPDTPPPLVIISTNEERDLPAAFLRRCLVFNMVLGGGQTSLKAWLVERGRVHFGKKCSDDVLDMAADQLIGDREEAYRQGLIKPGQAEYLDLLRAVSRIAAGEDGQKAALEKVRDFALKKHPMEPEP